MSEKMRCRAFFESNVGKYPRLRLFGSVRCCYALGGRRKSRAENGAKETSTSHRLSAPGDGGTEDEDVNRIFAALFLTIIIILVGIKTKKLPYS